MDYLTKEKIKGEEFSERMARFGQIVENANGNWDLSDRDENAIRTADAVIGKLQLQLKHSRTIIEKFKSLWRLHQHTKFKNDGSHFQADMAFNELMADIEEWEKSK